MEVAGAGTLALMAESLAAACAVVVACTGVNGESDVREERG